jgi:hypothetical protein
LRSFLPRWCLGKSCRRDGAGIECPLSKVALNMAEGVLANTPASCVGLPRYPRKQITKFIWKASYREKGALWRSALTVCPTTGHDGTVAPTVICGCITTCCYKCLAVCVTIMRACWSPSQQYVEKVWTAWQEIVKCVTLRNFHLNMLSRQSDNRAKYSQHTFRIF